MDNDKKKVVINGMPLTSVLFVVFLVLKLCGVIDWPWIWVFAPLWIPFALVALLFVVLGIIYLYFRVTD